MFFRRSLTRPGHRRPGTLWMSAFVLGSVLAGCTVGPDFVPPTAAAPDDWTSWRSGDDSLRIPVAATDILPADWWRVFGDPVLERLQKRAFEASPDLQTAALHFAQARVQRRVVGAPGVPEVGFSGAMARQRLSEYGAGTRLIDAIADDRDPLVEILSEPFTLYQAGFDASWEIDLWGRVRRAVEAAEADVTRQAALLDYSRLSVSSEVARNYLELRTTQRQITVAREDLTVLEGRLALIEALSRRGVADYLDLQRQRIEVATLRARLPGLREQEAARANQIALLLGEPPGALRAALAPRAERPDPVLPALALGLPSEVALRRPDIRAAEARLHAATAGIGVARADLYPSVRLGANFGYESYLASEFADWGTRTWSVVPAVNLPLFDGGRRKSVVLLRELEQREAAVAYQRTVLEAWHEIDDALSGYAAEQQQVRQLTIREGTAREAYELAQARYVGGITDFMTVLDSQRGYLQARRDLVESEGRLGIRFVTINKVIGNAPMSGGPKAELQTAG